MSTEPVDRARTPLLALITQEALDRDYQTAASRRGPEGRTDGPATRTAVVAVVGVFAMLVTIAAVQTSANADVNDASRASLIGRVEARRTAVGNLQDDLATLREQNNDAEDALRVLGNRYATVQAQAASRGALTGFEAVRGDGVRVTVDNAPYADEDQAVRDSDLALLANGLWEAGAEAIAINGQRLTAVSGIRASGEAIEVNLIGIAPPYTVLAIGDPGEISSRFVDTPSGLQFIGRADQFGFSRNMDNEDDLRLPAAPASLRRLRAAHVEIDPKPKGGDLP